MNILLHLLKVDSNSSGDIHGKIATVYEICGKQRNQTHVFLRKIFLLMFYLL